MPGSEIDEEISWWKDNDLLREFDTEYQNWKSGKDKGYSLTEVDKLIDAAKLRRENASKR
ncbi:MAG: hypothetical protein V4649_01690 [Bacteroidota bacterium]